MILVTGGAGFIGSVLINSLLNKGLQVRVVDKLMFGSGGIDSHLDRIDLIQTDIRNMELSQFKGVKHVVHLAGLSNDPMANFNPAANLAINTEGTRHVAALAREAGVEKFIFASSCSIYDLGFDAEDFIRHEDSDVSPIAPYAVSKYEAESYLLDLKTDHFSPVIFRLGTVYGYSPRMRYDLVVNTFVKDALLKGTVNVDNGGEMWRPLIDVADVARAITLCLEGSAKGLGGEVFNLVFKNYRILELAHWVVEALRPYNEVTINVDYHYKPCRSYRVSAEKFLKKFPSAFKNPVRESVTHMVENIHTNQAFDFSHPRYYNIQWLTLLLEMEKTLSKVQSVL